MPAAPPRNPSPARPFSSLRRSISSPNRRPGQSRFGQGQTSHRDPSPAEERPKASISAREASGSGGSSTGKGQRGAGAPAVGDAGFRQSNVKVALSADGAAVPYAIEDIPVRPEPYFVIAFMDDNDNVDPEDMENAGPDSGDLLSLRGLASVSVTLDAPGEHALDIDLNSVLP